MLIPDKLSDPFTWLYHKHRYIATYLMHVPLTTEVVDIPKEHPQSFKAQTFATIIQFALWFIVKLGRDYKRIAFVFAHEIMHQMLNHGYVHWRWKVMGYICGRVRGPLVGTGPIICYPYDEGIVQKTFDYIINDGLRSTGMSVPEDAWIDWHNEGDWMQIEEDVYVRLFEEACRKAKLDPKQEQVDPNAPPQQKNDRTSSPPEQEGSSAGDDEPEDEDGEDDGDETGSGTSDSSDGDGAGTTPSMHPTTGVGSKPSLSPNTGSPGCGGYDVVPTDPHKARPDIEGRRKNAFIKAMAALTPSQIAGLGAGNIEKLIERVHPTKMDWKDVVRPRYNHYLGGPKTVWGPFDHSALAMGRTMPGRVMRRAGFVVLVLDTSSSITRPYQSAFIYGNWDMFKQTAPRRLLIIELDDMIHRTTDVRSLSQLENFLEPLRVSSAGLLGGGGTDMRKVHAYLVKEDLHPDMLIFFSDLYTPFPTGKGNAKDVTWVSITERIAPVAAGRTVRMWMD